MTYRPMGESGLMVFISKPKEMRDFLEVALPELASACDQGDGGFEWIEFERAPPEPEAEEAEMGDDELDVLGRVIDLGAVLAEALALALPAWPRAADAELPDLAGAQAATEEVRRPFAGLSDLLADKVGGGAGDEKK